MQQDKRLLIAQNLQPTTNLSSVTDIDSSKPLFIS